ncbi:MAG: alpha-E domain-containing protein, partial [Pseudomonadota bacterium]
VFGERDNPSSIISSLSSARENMRTAREIMPSEAWEQVNSLYLRVSRRSQKGLPRGSRHTVLNNVVQSCQQITGMLAGTMNHDAAYQFIRIGRNLERADMSTRIIDAASAGLTGSEEEAFPYQNVLWISVLQSLSAYQMYRLTVQRKVNPQDVLLFLFQSEVFPRAVLHCLGELHNGMTPLSERDSALREIKRVRRRVKAMEYASLEGPALSEFVHNVQVDLEALHKVIGLTWFSSDTP